MRRDRRDAREPDERRLLSECPSVPPGRSAPWRGMFHFPSCASAPTATTGGSASTRSHASTERGRRARFRARGSIARNARPAPRFSLRARKAPHVASCRPYSQPANPRMRCNTIGAPEKEPAPLCEQHPIKLGPPSPVVGFTRNGFRYHFVAAKPHGRTSGGCRRCERGASCRDDILMTTLRA